MKSSHRINTAATLQAVYLVWLFLRITTMCNLSVFGLVRGKFPESFAHVQTVDIRPLFPPTTWPGYEAKCWLVIYLREIAVGSHHAIALKRNLCCLLHSACLYSTVSSCIGILMFQLPIPKLLPTQLPFFEQ